MQDNTVRQFTDKLPIGIGDDGSTYVFLYLVTRPLPADFRMFLERHAELCRALPAWSVRLLIPHHLSNSMNRYQEAFREQVGSPLRPTQLQELRWFFEARRSGSQQTRRRTSSIARNARSATPRFRVLYRAWIEQGDRVLDAVVSPTLATAIARQTGKFEARELVASVSPSRSSGRHGVISGDTQCGGGGGRGDDVRGTISPLQEAE